MTRSTASAPHKLDVGPGGIEVGVVRDDIAFLAHDAEKDAFGGTTLVGGDDVSISKDVLNRVAELIEATAARVTLIAFHHGGPLVTGHGAGAGIGQKVDQDVVGRKEKEVIVCGAKQIFALLASSSSNGLDALDAERLNDGLRHEDLSLTTYSPARDVSDRDHRRELSPIAKDGRR